MILQFCVIFRSSAPGQKPVGLHPLPCQKCCSGPLAESFWPSCQSFLRPVAPWDSSIHRLLDHSRALEQLRSHRRSVNRVQPCFFLRCYWLHVHNVCTVCLQMLTLTDLTWSAWSPPMASSADLHGHCLPVCSTEVCKGFISKGSMLWNVVKIVKWYWCL